jgi:hypothetical protein
MSKSKFPLVLKELVFPSLKFSELFQKFCHLTLSQNNIRKVAVEYRIGFKCLCKLLGFLLDPRDHLFDHDLKFLAFFFLIFFYFFYSFVEFL